MKNLENFYCWMLTRDNSFREDALTDEGDGYVVDTACPPDIQKWETGIRRSDKEWVIVEQYKDEEEARAGHARWLNLMMENLNCELTNYCTPLEWAQGEKN